MRIGLAQIAPHWLNRAATVDKVLTWIGKAADEGCRLAVFGEALIPGYPFWVERTEGARFESELQKSLYAHYVSQGVCIEDGDLDDIRSIATERKIAVYLGIMVGILYSYFALRFPALITFFKTNTDTEVLAPSIAES